MKRQHHGCLPSQMSARAMAERLSLLLHGCCRHPSKRNATSEITGVEMRRVARQRGLAGPVRRTLIGNVGDEHAETGSVRILQAGCFATRRTKVSRLR